MTKPDAVERHPLLIPEVVYIVLQYAFAADATSRSCIDAFGLAARELRHGAAYCRLSLVCRVWSSAADSIFLSALCRHRAHLSTPASRRGQRFRLNLPPERTWPQIRRLQIFLSWTKVRGVGGDEECVRDLLAFFDQSPGLCDVEIVCETTHDLWLPDVATVALSHPALKSLEIRAPSPSWDVLRPLLEAASGDRVEVLRLNLPRLTDSHHLPSAPFPKLRELTFGGKASGALHRCDPALFDDFLSQDFSCVTRLTLGLTAQLCVGFLVSTETDIYVRVLERLAPRLVHLRLSDRLLSHCPPSFPALPKLVSLHVDCTDMIDLNPWHVFWSACNCRSLERLRLDFAERYEGSAFFIAQKVAQDCPRLKTIEMGGGRFPLETEIVLRSMAEFNGQELVLQDDKLLPLEAEP